MVNHVQHFCFLFGESRSIFFINAERCRTLLRWNSDVVDFFLSFFSSTLLLFSATLRAKGTYIFIIRLIVSGQKHLNKTHVQLSILTAIIGRCCECVFSYIIDISRVSNLFMMFDLNGQDE